MMTTRSIVFFKLAGRVPPGISLLAHLRLPEETFRFFADTDL